MTALRLTAVTSSPGPFTIVTSDALTNTVNLPLVISHATSGTAAAAFGTAISFNLQNGSGTLINYGRLINTISTATAGNEGGQMEVWLQGGGSLQKRFTVTESGSINGINSVTATAACTIYSGTAVPAGGTAGVGYKLSSTSNFGVFFGSGAPSLAAAQGSLYLRSDGSSAITRAYINTDGSTTWTAVSTVL